MNHHIAEPVQAQEDLPKRTPQEQRADHKREQFSRMGLLNRLLEPHQPKQPFHSFFRFP